jgi:hypothetical protein
MLSQSKLSEQNGCLWPLMDQALETITEQDLLDLIDNQIREDKRTEFKLTHRLRISSPLL